MREYFIWLLKLITLAVIICFGVPLLIAAAGMVGQDGLSDSLSGEKHEVAVIELTGMIESSKDILEQLHKQVKNEKVKGIVLRIDSPGGAVGPSQDIYSAVKRLKEQKPIVVSMGSLAASGGLYSALGASKIFAQPGTITGSIGVILQIPNVQKITDRIGLDMVTIKSGKMKDVGNSFREMSPEEREFLESTVAAAHTDFVQAVSDGRGIPREQVLSFADGRIILGSQARDLKLIDNFGDVYDAARAVFDILGSPLPAGESPKLVYVDDRYGKIMDLLEGAVQFVGISHWFGNQVQLRYVMF